MTEKNWIVAFATKKFYITEEDALFYTQELGKGAKFVRLKSGILLSDKALYVIPVSVTEEAEKLDKGKVQCGFGKWHYNAKDCRCEVVKQFEEKLQLTQGEEQ